MKDQGGRHDPFKVWTYKICLQIMIWHNSSGSVRDYYMHFILLTVVLNYSHIDTTGAWSQIVGESEISHPTAPKNACVLRFMDNSIHFSFVVYQFTALWRQHMMEDIQELHFVQKAVQTYENYPVYKIQI